MKFTAHISLNEDSYFLSLDSEAYEYIKKKKISHKKLYNGLALQTRYWTYHGGGSIVVEYYCKKKDLNKVIESVKSYGNFEIEIINKIDLNKRVDKWLKS